VDWNNMLIGLLQNKQNVSVNPLNLGRIIEMVSQVVAKFIQGQFEFAPRVQIKCGIVLFLCFADETLQGSLSIKRERLGFLYSQPWNLGDGVLQIMLFIKPGFFRIEHRKKPSPYASAVLASQPRVYKQKSAILQDPFRLSQKVQKGEMVNGIKRKNAIQRFVPEWKTHGRGLNHVGCSSVSFLEVTADLSKHVGTIVYAIHELNLVS